MSFCLLVFQAHLDVLVAFLVTEERTAASEPLGAPSQGPQPMPGPEYKQMPLQMPLWPAGRSHLAKLPSPEQLPQGQSWRDGGSCFHRLTT